MINYRNYRYRYANKNTLILQLHKTIVKVLFIICITLYYLLLLFLLLVWLL